MYSIVYMFREDVQLKPKGLLSILVNDGEFFLRLAYPQQGKMTPLTPRLVISLQELKMIGDPTRNVNIDNLHFITQGHSIHVSLDDLPPLYVERVFLQMGIRKAIESVAAS